MKTTKLYFGGSRRVKTSASIAMNVISAFIALYLLSGCSSIYYAPSAQNVPLFEKKKETNLSGDFRMGAYTKGYDFQAAVAATDHLGITTSFSHFSGEEENYDWYYGDIQTTPYTSNTFDIGLGYYLPFGKKFVFEVYSGYGTSTFKSNSGGSTNTGIIKVHSNCFFLQPEIGLRTKHFELAFSDRIRVNSYGNIQYEVGYAGHESDYWDDEMNQNPTVCFLEPAFTLRAGGESVKFQFQVGPSFLVSKNWFIAHDPLNLNFGLFFRIGGKKEADPVQ